MPSAWGSSWGSAWGSSFGPTVLVSGYSLWIGDTERYAKLSSFRAELVLNGHDTMTAFILPTEGSPEVRFAIDDPVALLKDSTPLAGGIVTHIGEEMEPEGGPNGGRFLSRITVSGFGEIASRRHVSLTIAGGSPGTSLSDVLQDLIDMTDGLGDDGVTLHPSQATGPTVKAQVFEDELPSAILNRLAQQTGRVWRIDEQKRLRMWAKGDIAAAFDIDEDDLPAKYFGDIRRSNSRFEGYANRVIVKGTKQTIFEYGETQVSTGVETVYTATQPMIGFSTGAVKVTNVPSLGVPLDGVKWETAKLVGGPGSPTWEVDVEARTFTRVDGALPDDAIVRLIYDAEVSPRGVANDAPDQALFPVRDEIVHAPLTTDADAQALAEDILPYLVAAKETKATYSTRETDLILPGVTQTMTVPSRALSGAFMVERVTLRSGPGELNSYLIQDIETTQNQILKGDWRDLIPGFTVGPSGTTVTGGAGDSSQDGGDTVTNPDGDGGSGSNVAVPPDDTDLIINKKGAFGTIRSGVGGHIRGLYENAANFMLGTPAAPTVANTGSGSYAATLRYYKAQFAQLSGTSIAAISNFGASVSFTPSGSGTHARVTKPASPGATETHWRVLGSADDVTFVAISAWIVLATTTYDDNVAPGSYVHVGDDQLAYNGEYDTMAQLLLTKVSNDLDSLQKWQSYNGGGVVSVTPWASSYPGEVWIGASYINGQCIAHSAFVAQVFLDATGDGYLALRLYWNQTPGEPLDESVFNEINLRAFTATGNAGGEGGIDSSTHGAMWHAATLALRDQLGAGSFEIPVKIAGTHTDNTRELRFQMGDVSRTIRFDGVGTAVTFT